MFNLKRKHEDRLVNLVTLDSHGHSEAQRRLSTITKEEVMRPDRSILVNGKACDTWDEVLNECHRAPKEQPIEMVSMIRMVGG